MSTLTMTPKKKKNFGIVPTRATRSVRSSPWSLNLVTIVSNVELTRGMLLLEAIKLAAFASLLPKYTSQLGPPVCI